MLLSQSDSHVVLATLKRSESELSTYQRKVFKIDDHMGIAIAGLTADGRVLCKYMRNECMNHRWGSREAPRMPGTRGRRVCAPSWTSVCARDVLGWVRSL